MTQHNIAIKPISDQRKLQRDLKAALWANQVNNGKAKHGEVLARIQKLGDQVKIEDMSQRFFRYLNMKLDTRGQEVKPMSQEDRLNKLQNMKPTKAQNDGTPRSADGLWSRPLSTERKRA